MGTGERESVGTSEREIKVSRVIDAPREMVFDAFTDPKQIVKWWGPRGFDTKDDKIDIRPGGEWTFLMVGPDGTEYPNRIGFEEIVRPERIVYMHGNENADDPTAFRTTVAFAEQDGKTKLTMTALFPSKAARDFVVEKYGALQGAKDNLDKLDEHVATVRTKAFVIERTYDAPRDLVWKAFTEADRLAQWWGPKGMEMVRCTVDLRPGGLFHYAMKSPQGHEMWGKFVYREIVEPKKLVFVVSFSNAEGGAERHPLSPTWPLEVLNIITFTERDSKTLVTMVGAPVNATDIERKTFEDNHASLAGGFKPTLDSLEEYLKRAS